MYELRLLLFLVICSYFVFLLFFSLSCSLKSGVTFFFSVQSLAFSLALSFCRFSFLKFIIDIVVVVVAVVVESV